MKTYSIVMDVKPAGKGRPTFTKKGRPYTPKKTRLIEEQIQFWLLSHRPPPGFTGALEVEIHFSMKRPKVAGKHPTTYPDIDNAGKLVLDACNKIVWPDDRFITRLYMVKEYADRNEIEIRVREVPDTMVHRLWIIPGNSHSNFKDTEI